MKLKHSTLLEGWKIVGIYLFESEILDRLVADGLRWMKMSLILVPYWLWPGPNIPDSDLCCRYGLREWRGWEIFIKSVIGLLNYV